MAEGGGGQGNRQVLPGLRRDAPVADKPNNLWGPTGQRGERLHITRPITFYHDQSQTLERFDLPMFSSFAPDKKFDPNRALRSRQPSGASAAPSGGGSSAGQQSSAPRRKLVPLPLRHHRGANSSAEAHARDRRELVQRYRVELQRGQPQDAPRGRPAGGGGQGVVADGSLACTRNRAALDSLCQADPLRLAASGAPRTRVIVSQLPPLQQQQQQQESSPARLLLPRPAPAPRPVAPPPLPGAVTASPLFPLPSADAMQLSSQPAVPQPAQPRPLPVQAAPQGPPPGMPGMPGMQPRALPPLRAPPAPS
eukprot:TRINITY_DN1531_c0_g2_i1.p1 TRINITY_DN1531_c0_g2~~TRINITY_DN1531_c0_g2_i1.p1  ORF type:complete len:348 (+),score=67.96 TRINITY_DN1531_c0_g2_i1:119-1045(+)